MRRRHEPRGEHALCPRGRGTFQFQIFIQTPSPEIWSETISGSEEAPGGEWGSLFWATSLEKISAACAHLVPPNVGWMQQSPAVRRRAILPVGSTGGPGH